MNPRPTTSELRQAVLGRVDTFTTHVDWIGTGAELAFADSVIAFADWLATCEPTPDKDLLR